MPIKKLDAQNAVIKTAAVEVKTLTISGKQVTLAVFRQLPEKNILAFDYDRNGTPDFGLLGVPWGIVNYHPDKCEAFAKHAHVVWQEEETLYRCRVYVHPVYGRWYESQSLFVVVSYGEGHHYLYTKDRSGEPRDRVDWSEAETNAYIALVDKLLADLDQLYIAV
jgi:hypothetical protein